MNGIKKNDEINFSEVQQLTNPNKQLIWGLVKEIFNKFQLLKTNRIAFFAHTNSNNTPTNLDWVYGKEYLENLKLIQFSKFNYLNEDGYKGYRINLEILDVSAFLKIYDFLGIHLGHLSGMNPLIEKDTLYISNEGRFVRYMKDGIQKNVKLTKNQARVLNFLYEEFPTPRSMKYINIKIFEKEKQYLSQVFRDCKEYQELISSEVKNKNEKLLYKIAFKNVIKN